MIYAFIQLYQKLDTVVLRQKAFCCSFSIYYFYILVIWRATTTTPHRPYFVNDMAALSSCLHSETPGASLPTTGGESKPILNVRKPWLPLKRYLPAACAFAAKSCTRYREITRNVPGPKAYVANSHKPEEEAALGDNWDGHWSQGINL